MPKTVDVEGRWRLLRPIACGGEARVWLGESCDDRRPVAIKLGPRAARERIAREFAIGSTIRHRGVARVLEWGLSRDGGEPFLIAEWAGRTTLARSRRPLLGPRWLTAARQLLAALGAVHRAGWVHRDVKPSNVVGDARSGGALRLIDFGLASASGRRELAGVISGSPAYIPPEAIAGAPVDARGDLYSAGLLLYRLLCGGPLPSESTDWATALAWHLEGQGLPSVSGAPPRWIDWLNLLTARDVERRPASAEAAWNALEALSAERGPRAHDGVPPGRRRSIRAARDAARNSRRRSRSAATGRDSAAPG